MDLSVRKVVRDSFKRVLWMFQNLSNHIFQENDTAIANDVYGYGNLCSISNQEFARRIITFCNDLDKKIGTCKMAQFHDKSLIRKALLMATMQFNSFCSRLNNIIIILYNKNDIGDFVDKIVSLVHDLTGIYYMHGNRLYDCYILPKSTNVRMKDRLPTLSVLPEPPKYNTGKIRPRAKFEQHLKNRSSSIIGVNTYCIPSRKTITCLMDMAYEFDSKDGSGIGAEHDSHADSDFVSFSDNVSRSIACEERTWDSVREQAIASGVYDPKHSYLDDDWANVPRTIACTIKGIGMPNVYATPNDEDDSEKNTKKKSYSH